MSSKKGLRCEDCRKYFPSLTVVALAHQQYREICEGCFTAREAAFAKSMRAKPRPYRPALVHRGGIL